MKARERHHLKQNEFAATVARISTTIVENKDRVMIGAVGVLLVALLAGGYLFWQKHTNDQASALFGAAMAIAEAPIAPAPTVPGSHQAPGTYPTERARQEAALQAFQRVASAYPSTTSGLAARYHAAGALLALGRSNEAEQAFRDVITRGGSSIYAPAARMGLAETLVAEGQFDTAIKTYTDLSADRNGPLPIDGVLMQLARACVKAGKVEEARAAYKRVVDEFPESSFVTEAKQKLTLMN